MLGRGEESFGGGEECSQRVWEEDLGVAVIFRGRCEPVSLACMKAVKKWKRKEATNFPLVRGSREAEESNGEELEQNPPHL